MRAYARLCWKTITSENDITNVIVKTLVITLIHGDSCDSHDFYNSGLCSKYGTWEVY